MKLAPKNAELANLLAWILATQGGASKSEAMEAVMLAERVTQQTDHKDATNLDTLAAAYAAAGRFDDATQTAQLAVSLVPQNGSKDEVAQMRRRLRRYQKRQPYVEGKH